MVHSTALSRSSALWLALLALPSPASGGRTLQELDAPARPSVVASSGAAVSAEALQRVASVLQAMPRKSAQSVGVQLALLGPGELPALFETLRLGVIHVRDASGEDRVLPLDELQEQA